MSFDISHLLDGWDYEPGQIVVRKFKTRTGVEKLQLRLDLGLLQMNADGRPDGKRPFGKETLLAHFDARRKRFLRTHPEGDSEFQLTAEECAKLQQEAVQFHHRYICLFQLQDFAGVIRDTDRNLRAYDFLKNHAPPGDLAWPLQHLIPQLLMLRARAQAMQAIESDDHIQAVDYVEDGLANLRNFYREISRSDMVEHSGEIQSLEAFLKDIHASRPLTKREELEKALEDAVRREDYERAAECRDQLRSLSQAK